MSEALHSSLIEGRSVTPLGEQGLLINDIHTLLINRYTEGRVIDPRRGVGQARKIGCDIALTLIHEGRVTSSWIHTTDADARLPQAYFGQLPSDPAGITAYLSPFQHIADPGLEVATRLYEIRLLYYPAALAWAGSPYAYPTIGSTMTVDAISYAKVRGFPRRATGEDFYLLDKLRKLGEVATTWGEPIQIRGRESDRVPVGTGTALVSIKQLADQESDYRYEHPACFSALRDCLQTMRTAADQKAPALRFSMNAIHEFALTSGLYDVYERKRSESPGAAVMNKHLNDWFDGLKTRQLIHHLRDSEFGTIAAIDITSAPWMPGNMQNSQRLDEIRAALFNAVFKAHPASQG